jgi:predicted small lipoprotein YifL
MTMIKTLIVLIAMATLCIAGCGLKDDLYIPTEEPEVAPMDSQATDEKNAEEEPGRLAEPAP